MNHAIARRYAHAFFCLLNRDEFASAQEGLQALSHALKHSAALKHSLASPAVALEEKLNVLTALCERTGGPPVMGRFCTTTVKKQPHGISAGHCGRFQRAAGATTRHAARRAVVSAHPIDESMKQDLSVRLRKTLNSEVDVNFQSNPSLLSGLQIRIGSKVYDGTVRGQLNRMRAQLAKG